jgi:hypothetical protein
MVTDDHQLPKALNDAQIMGYRGKGFLVSLRRTSDGKSRIKEDS